MAGSLRQSRTEDEPLVRDALTSGDAERWVDAVDKEVQALRKLNCWSVVERPQQAKVLHSKFVLKKKRNSSGEVVKYKARLVVCGNEDMEFIEERFATVVDFTFVKLFLSIAIQRNWKVIQLDFDNAFPNGELHRDVYI